MAAVTPDDYRVVSARLERFARGFRLPPDDAAEVVAEVVAETMMRSSAGAGREVRQPGAYLFWTTRNRVLDRLRRAELHPTEPLDSEALERGTGRLYSDEDEAIVRLLERHATTAMIESALRAAAAADDHVVVRVVTEWLELAEELGREPTSREVAPEAGTSHTTVNDALRRLRAYLPLDGDRVAPSLPGEATLPKRPLSRQAIKKRVMAQSFEEVCDEARRWREKPPPGHTPKTWRDIGESTDRAISQADELIEDRVPENDPACIAYKEQLAGYCTNMRRRNKEVASRSPGEMRRA